jgi:HlyD family secretion protein
MTPVRSFATAISIVSVLAAVGLPGAVTSDRHLISIALAQSPPKTPSAQSDLQKLLDQSKTLLDKLRGVDMPAGIVKTNGRIEAIQVDIAAKYPGRLESVSVVEGDEVSAGQVIAVISSPEYEAQLRGAQAQVLKAKQALAEAEAMIAERQSDQLAAKNDLDRGKDLVAKGWMAQQVYDQRVNKAQATDALLRAAEAARDQAQFAIKTSQADVDRIEAILVDLKLVAPRSGRIQYKISQAGEVVNGGTRILTLLDLHDVYMTIYLPAAQAGQLALGDEARIIIDPAPQYVIPATISFVAADAQFTPKSVETADERQKLMFRVKLQIDPKVLDQYHSQVKTGIRGIGFVRTDTAVPWPADLTVKLPPK